MKSKFLWSKCLLLFAVLGISVVAILSTAYAEDAKITVLNPAVTEKLAERVPLVPRLAGLEGKTVYLVDMNYEGIGGGNAVRHSNRFIGE
ncbi:MAG: hypothetical protein P8Y80_12475 [Acidobacteriota bacterium]